MLHVSTTSFPLSHPEWPRQAAETPGPRSFKHCPRTHSGASPPPGPHVLHPFTLMGHTAVSLRLGSHCPCPVPGAHAGPEALAASLMTERCQEDTSSGKMCSAPWHWGPTAQGPGLWLSAVCSPTWLCLALSTSKGAPTCPCSNAQAPPPRPSPPHWPCPQPPISHRAPAPSTAHFPGPSLTRLRTQEGARDPGMGWGGADQHLPGRCQGTLG